jgi:hypothetical protein
MLSLNILDKFSVGVTYGLSIKWSYFNDFQNNYWFRYITMFCSLCFSSWIFVNKVIMYDNVTLDTLMGLDRNDSR